MWILLKQKTVSGSGIRWAKCKSAPRSRQITMPAPHHSDFYRLDALPAAQPTASKQEINNKCSPQPRNSSRFRTNNSQRAVHSRRNCSGDIGCRQTSQGEWCSLNVPNTHTRTHILGMQVCTSLQTDNHTSTPPLCFYRPDALPAVQPTVSK